METAVAIAELRASIQHMDGSIRGLAEQVARQNGSVAELRRDLRDHVANEYMSHIQEHRVTEARQNGRADVGRWTLRFLGLAVAVGPAGAGLVTWLATR